MDSNSITSLLDGSTATNPPAAPTSLLPAGFAGLFTVFMIVTTVVSLLIAVLYILNMITTYRAHKASIETRDILREMNERDKARSLPTDRSPATYASAETNSTSATTSDSSTAV